MRTVLSSILQRHINFRDLLSYGESDKSTVQLIEKFVDLLSILTFFLNMNNETNVVPFLTFDTRTLFYLSCISLICNYTDLHYFHENILVSAQ